jgi:hypothetical protein
MGHVSLLGILDILVSELVKIPNWNRGLKIFPLITLSFFLLGFRDTGPKQKMTSHFMIQK